MTDNASRERTLESVLNELSTSRPAVADEIQALQAIFGDDKLTLHSTGKPADSP